MDLVLGGWEAAGEGRGRLGGGTFFFYCCGKEGGEGRGWRGKIERVGKGEGGLVK